MEQDYYALFAAHHRRLINPLGTLSSRVRDDVVNTPELLTYLWEHLVPHAQGEEATLYQRAATLPGGDTLVSSMIGEPRAIVARSRELSALFATQAEAELQEVLRSVWALIDAHFPKEEDALLPLLPQHLTATEFGRLRAELHPKERDLKPSDITRFMALDHRRVDQLLAAFSTLQSSDGKRAAVLFASGRERLLRHMRWEEDVLFPAFEDKTGLHDAGPTVVLGQEHAQIKATLEQMAKMLEEETVAGLEAVAQELVSVLTGHNQKEERILYPLLNQSLSAQERTTVLEKMQ